MASFVFNFKSKVLGKDTNIAVILPDCETVPENGWKTLYLLHGWSDNYMSWLRYTSIERYAKKRDLAVIMPDGEFSFYNDMADGLRYKTYLTEELPKVVNRYFRCSLRREDSFIGGLSMGGCGSLTVGLSRPDLYAGIICLSATNFPGDMFQLQHQSGRMSEGWYASMRRIYGDAFPDIKGTDHDAFVMTEKILAAGGPYPVLFQYMGLEEVPSLDFAKKMEEYYLSMPGNPFNYKLATYHGVHNWDAWDAHICEGLDHVGLTEV